MVEGGEKEKFTGRKKAKKDLNFRWGLEGRKEYRACLVGKQEGETEER